MKRFGWQWFVVSSVLLSAAAAAATRPQYGGTLHVAIEEAPASLDPADLAGLDSFAQRNLTELIFETLVTIDEGRGEHPALAISWQAAPGDQRWQFRLRPNIRFHDGSVLTPEIAAASLRKTNPWWKVLAQADSVVIECPAPDANLPSELALARNAIAKRSDAGKLSGTGPFHIEEWQPGRKLKLGAEEAYWRGRPFADAVEVEMGKNYSSQLISLDLGKAQLVEVAAEQAHRLSTDGHRIAASQPMELVALLFAHDAQTPEENILRRALAQHLDRASMRSVLLQGAGQPSAGILPDWMSGYGLVFSAAADQEQAHHESQQVRAPATWSVGYDSNDPMARLVAERVVLNARDAGLTLQSTTATATDLRVIRIPLASTDSWVALAQVAGIAGVPMPKVQGHSVEDLYTTERALLATQRIIPLFHLPVSSALSPALRDFRPSTNGSWHLADAWLENDRL